MSNDAYVAPGTRLESAIAGIWRDVLGVDQVGLHDDFFELGGESLAAVHMLAAVDDLLLTPVSFADFLDAPTVAALAQAVQRARRHQGAAAPALEPGPASGTAPCTFAQERLWFVDQLGGATGAYNEPLAARIRGALDVEALEWSLDQLAGRHSAIRTSFAVTEGIPVQVTAEDAGLELERIDLSDRANPEEELHHLAEELASRPFDLQRAPLVRAYLLRVGAEDHVLQLVFHHSISDGWSHTIVFRELGELYRARSSGAPAELPAPKLQYPDFARWQRSRMQGEALEQVIAPWRERLADIPAALDLPTDHPRPPIQSHRGATRRARLDAASTEAVRSFSRAERVTLFTTLLAVFDVLLHRYSGQETIMLGSATAGRDRLELEEVVGLFANTIVLRNDVSGDPSFRELLSRVRHLVLDAVAHQEAPFEHLVAELQREPDLSRHPIFQVFLAFRPHASLRLPGAEPFYAGLRTSRADLTLWIEDAPEGLELVWEYCTDLFEPGTIARMERHFLRLLRVALAEPELKLSRLPMLDQTERGQLLEDSGARGTGYPVSCMHTLFEAQVALCPDAPAVAFEGKGLSYCELNERANRLAHRLRELGIGPESRVALFLERSLELVVAILGVLKAGGAYIPLDPEYPAARIAFVLSDTSAPVLLTQGDLLERLPTHEAQVLCLDRPDAELQSRSSANPETLGGPDNLAYIIYTSGSTGQPKGVQVEHRQIARLFTATEHWYGFGPSDTWVLAHSYAFDVSVWELWGALAHGGRIIVPPFWVTRSPEAFAALVAEHHVTVLSATPSLFSAVQDELLRHSGELALRFVVFAGEALHPPSLRPWFDRFGDGGATLVNMYGITETTVHTTYRVMRAADCERDTSPIGVPIPDLSLYLLDAAGEPVPDGVAGEIYVGGDGVTRGYLNRPELTAQRFLENPFAPGRLYRSGDLARRLRDGEVGFLGRMDDQVKVRGFRIELGEVQAVLEEHDAVAESAVVAVKLGADDVRLVAYVVPDDETAGPIRAMLRLQLEGRLIPEQLLELPDGTAVVHVNRAETEFLYEEHFVRGGYFKHGIEIPDDACVLDVGANIGLFALLVGRRAPGARILAFEPMPAAHNALLLNAELHGLQAQIFECALGATSGQASFTYFPHVTILSGRGVDPGVDAAVLREMLEKAERGVSRSEVEELLQDRLEHETIDRPVRTVSEMLQEQEVDRVDLLKVDVEGAEIDVLAGIDKEDWRKIRQVVLEVHGGEARVREVRAILEPAGFEVFVEEDEFLRGSGLYNMFARREPLAPAGAAHPARWRSPARLREALRTQLEERLPGYMVPSSITPLDELPLTTNGKLNRRMLPAPEWETQREATFVAPRGDTELLVASIWQEVLGVERVGAEDSFFRLGGHSLIAARVIARIRDAAAIELSVRTLFEYPTLADFAERVDRAANPSTPVQVVEEASPTRAEASEYPLSFQQEQLLFFEALEPGSVTYNAVLAVRVHGDLDVETMRRALAAVLERHEALRTVLVLDEGSGRQVVLDPAPAELEVVDLAGVEAPAREAALARLLVERGRRPFDLARDSMLRTTVFMLTPGESVLLFQTHHVAFDAWAVEVFYRDLAECYRAALERRAPDLPELSSQYTDYARRQRERLRGERLDAELDFWRAHLAGAPTLLKLPTDKRRPLAPTFEGETFPVVLGADLAAAVKGACQAHEVTPYILLLAAIATVLYRHTGQDDILLGGPMSNREQPGLEHLVGFFANTIVVRARLAGNPSFAELLASVRESVLRSYEHHEVPLQMVVDAVRPERHPGVNPLFQLNFRVRIGDAPVPELPGARCEPVPVDLGLARFELALELHLAEEFEAEFTWNTALFERSTVLRLAEDFESILRQVLADPGTRLLSLRLSEQPEAPTPAAVPSIRRFASARREARVNGDDRAGQPRGGV